MANESEMPRNMLDARVLQRVLADAPLHKWLGLELIEYQQNYIKLSIPWRDEFNSNDISPLMDSGIIATFINTTAYFVVMGKTGSTCAPIDSRVDYIVEAKPGRLFAQSQVLQMDRKVLTVETNVTDEEGRRIATAHGVYLPELI